MKFQKYDEIDHPSYGRGIVKKVIEPKASVPVLEVLFDRDGIKKQLNAKWVEKNCLCYSALSDEEVQNRYVSVELDGLPDWHLEMVKGLEFSGSMKENLTYLLKNTIPGIGFVIIGDNSVAAFFPDEVSGYKSIEKIARRYMSGVFSRHPDFGVTVLEDQGAFLFMNNDRLIHIIPPEKSFAQNGKLPGHVLFEGRGELMNQCQGKHIYGIIKAATDRSVAAFCHG